MFLHSQEAFLSRKQIFISKCRERQKRIALGKENRHLQECLRLEREAIFADQDRPLAPNLHAHPCSGKCLSFYTSQTHTDLLDTNWMPLFWFKLEIMLLSSMEFFKRWAQLDPFHKYLSLFQKSGSFGRFSIISMYPFSCQSRKLQT